MKKMASGLFVTTLITVAILTNGANVQPKNSEASMEVKVLKMIHLFFVQFRTITQFRISFYISGDMDFEYFAGTSTQTRESRKTCHGKR